MPVLACPKCRRPFCVEPTEESLKETLRNLGVLMKGKQIVVKKRLRKPKMMMQIPPSGIECAFCHHRFKLNQAVRLA